MKLPNGKFQTTLVIGDIDGCLMDNSHRAHLVPREKGRTKDWERFNHACINDAPIAHMIQVVNYLQKTPGHEVVLCTGRTETCRAETLQSLADGGLLLAKALWPSYQHLPKATQQLTCHMRAEDDHRHAAEYKLEAICTLLDFYRPQYVVLIEDDQTIIDAVNAAGFQVDIHIIKVSPHNGCAAVARNTPPAAPRYSLRDARDDLVELLAQAKEDHAPGEIGLAEALDFLDECLGDPKVPPHASHAEIGRAHV